MANRSDNAPKRFRQMPCSRCGKAFQATGPAAKRCDPCKLLHKREYEAANKRAKNSRPSRCLRCGKPFPADVHAHTKYCEPCAMEVHRIQNNASQLRRHHERYSKDAGRRLHLSMSVLVRRSLAGNKAGRRWETLVGYTATELRRHLERQFIKGMTWENIGKWHVDHILPRASFSFFSADDDEFKACWALTNLRPLWGVDNQKKSNRRTHLL